MDVNAKAKVEGSVALKISRLNPKHRDQYARLIQELTSQGWSAQAAVDIAKERIVLEHGESAYTVEDIGTASAGGEPVAAGTERIERNNAMARENERRFQDEQDRRRQHGAA